MEYKLKECLEKIIDNRGKNPVYLEFGEYPVIDNVLIKNNLYPNMSEVTRFISRETYNEFLRGYVEKDMPIMTLVGSGIGNVSLAPCNECAIVQNTIGFKVKENILDKKYLYYWFLTKQLELKNLNRGSGQPSIKKTDIEEMKIELPKLDIQKKIVKILFDIDKKIELNNQMNENLQEVINKYYREKLINNSSIVLKKMNELVEITIGGDWGKEELTGNYNSEVLCIRGADIPEMDCGNKGKAPTRFVLEKNLRNKQLHGNEIIIEISGGSPTQSTGRCAYITTELKKVFDKPLICTNFCRAIKLRDDKYLPIFYMHLKDLYSKNIMFLYENGTTGIKNLDLLSLLENEEIGIVSDKEINKCNELFYAINKKIIKNAHENRTLEILRDTLLPKLMNGEIDLDKVEI